MKWLVFSYYLFAIQLPAQSTVEAELKRVIATEVQGFLQASDALAANWVVQPYSVLNVSFTVPENSWTWFPTPAQITQWMGEDKPIHTGAHLTQDNFRFRILDNAALLVFEQRIDYSDKPSEYSHELKFIEKIDGAWKITATSAHFYQPASPR